MTRRKKQAARNRRRHVRRLGAVQGLEPRLMLTTINVTTTADVIDANDGVTSLREAVIQSNNTTSGNVTINLPSGVFGLTRSEGGEEFAQTGDLDIRRSVTIVGNEPQNSLADFTIIDGLEDTVIFDILGSGRIDVTFENLALVNGRGRGGAIRALPNGGTIEINNSILSHNEFRGAGSDDALGGAIYIDGGTLILDNTDVEQNTAKGSDGAADSANNNVDHGGDGTQARGGGIYAINSDVIVRNGSNIRWNEARGGDGGTGEETGGNAEAGIGGGIYHNGGTLTIVDSSVYDNVATGGAGGSANEYDGGNGGNAFGGGIAVRAETSVVTITSSLIYDNRANASRGGHARTDNNSDGDGGEGGDAQGGGLYTLAPELIITDSEFGENFARGGAGGETMQGDAGHGGTAMGGAISVAAAADITISGDLQFTGEVDLDNPEAGAATVTTSFIGNQAVGGNGGFKRQTEKAGGVAGNGGSARGGAIHHSNSGTLTLDQVLIAENIARGGFGGDGNVFLSELSGEDNDELSIGTRGGSNGNGLGGGVFTASDLLLTSSSLVGNIAAGGGTGQQDRVAAGAGGVDSVGGGITGGNGGNAYGGAVYIDRADATIEDTGLANNTALGGIGGQGGTAFAYENDDGDTGDANGGDGGDGGDASGGAIFARLDASDTLNLNHAVISGNSVIGGQGGHGGYGAMAGNNPYASQDGGRGGAGGVARGGGVYVEYDGSSAAGGALFVDDTVVSGSRVIGGDGGDGGHGGSGYIIEFQEEEDTGLIGIGGWADRGGHGGDAAGGGFYLRYVHSEITNTTIDSNVVSSGWGGDGGFGGSGNVSNYALGFDATFVGLGDTDTPLYAGDGGDGGDAGDAAGGGLRVLGGSLLLQSSTVYKNIVIAGAGGDGGDGGLGERGGGDGGNGGDGGKARGGGLYGLDSTPQITIVGSTIAENVVNAGFAGSGGRGGDIFDFSGFSETTSRYYSRLGIGFVTLTPVGDTYDFIVASSSAVLTASGAVTDPALASFVHDDWDTESTDFAADLYSDGATGAAILGASAAVGATAGAAAGIQTALVVASVFTTEAAATGTGALVGGAVLATALPIAGFTALVTVGVVVGVKIVVALAGGASFGDAIESAINVPDTGSGPNLAVLFGGGNQSETFIVTDFRGPGNDGAEGQAGSAVGSGIASDAHLSRSIIAGNSARRREVSKELVRVTSDLDLQLEPPGRPGRLAIGGLIFDQTIVDIAADEVASEGVVTSDGSNLIGADSAGVFPNDLTGSAANPLDPMLQEVLGMHDGDTPTLALLAGSPARDAVSINGSVTSQNGIVSSDTTSIGAWAGAAGQDFAGDFNGDDAVDTADFTIWRNSFGATVTPFSGSDADGDGQIDVDDYQIWKANFGNRLAQPLTGDFNGDGAVNTADFTVWRDTLGDSVTPFSGADADGDGEITVADYQAWRENFGATATVSAATAVAQFAPAFESQSLNSEAVGAANLTMTAANMEANTADVDSAFDELAGVMESTLPPPSWKTQANRGVQSSNNAKSDSSQSSVVPKDFGLLLVEAESTTSTREQEEVFDSIRGQHEHASETTEEAFAYGIWQGEFTKHQ